MTRSPTAGCIVSTTASALTQVRSRLCGSGASRELRRLATDQGKDALAGRLLPFALNFGLLDRDQTTLVKFAHAWVAAFAGLPGWHQPEPSRPSRDPPDAVAKPTIDEQMMDPYVGMGIALTGWGT